MQADSQTDRQTKASLHASSSFKLTRYGLVNTHEMATTAGIINCYLPSSSFTFLENFLPFCF